jgi:protein TonB
MTSVLGRLTIPRALGILAITVAGSAIVLSGLVVMNRISHTPEADDVGPVIDFTVPPPPPPPLPPERSEPPRRVRRTTQPSLAPPPDIGSNLSGIAVALPGIETQGVDTVSESLLGDLDDVALTEDAVDEPPSFRNRVVPEYPERARQREIEGAVLITVLVGTDGRVQSTQILESNPPGIFDDAVIAAVTQSTFEPAMYRGNPVEAWVNIPFPFRLN